MSSSATAFGDQLKSWRTMRKVSQLHLALSASVSQRHLSWLETGKSHPSRAMVIQLADALDVPLRARNVLLDSAGFAPFYRESAIETSGMEAVQEALHAMLAHHDPYPGIVLNRLWCVVKTNQAANALLSLLGDEETLWKKVDPTGRRSLARLTLHPEGLRPLIANWSEVAWPFMHRLRRDAEASGNADEREEYRQLLELMGDQQSESLNFEQDLLPVIPLVLDVNGLQLELFTVISTFGTPQDITVDELRIESFFPANNQTREFFLQLSG